MTDHIPDPTAMSGTLETTNTGGGAHERLSGVTRVFHHAEAVARNLIEEIRHHGDHAATQPVSQVAEDVTVPDPAPLGDSDSGEHDASTEAAPPGDTEAAPEAPLEDPAQDESTETPAEAQADAETPAEDAPAAPKTARKRAATKPAPDAPAEAGQ